MMMTKACTECYYDRTLQDHVPAFTPKQVRPKNNYLQKIFKSQDRFEELVVKQHLAKIQKDLEEAKALARPLVCPLLPTKRPPPTWKDIVNRKRQHVQRVIQLQATTNIAEVARRTGTHRSTVKSIMREMQVTKTVQPYEYNNLKPKAEDDSLQATINQLGDSFMMVTEIKRLHPTFSRKKILERLHENGYRYRLQPKEEENPKPVKINSGRVCRVISHICQAICDPNTTILYIDEMKFPLRQTMEKRWTHVGLPRENTLVYNRRPVPKETLTAIALCSLEKFEAVQVFRYEVTGTDFLYFLNEAVQQLPPHRHYTIIADNASWHHCKQVSQAEVSKFLFFNHAKMYQLNVIENAFSFVRHGFRSRPTVNTMEEEAKRIVDIFFDQDSGERFKGYFRHHLRNLQEFLEKHRPK